MLLNASVISLEYYLICTVSDGTNNTLLSFQLCGLCCCHIAGIRSVLGMNTLPYQAAMCGELLTPEMTVEEWISWMEEKKKQGMSSEQQLEYEHRKRAWMEREKERVEKRRKEDDEKIRKNRERMEEDYR